MFFNTGVMNSSNFFWNHLIRICLSAWSAVAPLRVVVVAIEAYRTPRAQRENWSEYHH